MKTTFRLLIAILVAAIFINPSCKPTDYSPDINALKARCDSLAAALEMTNANLQATNNTLESLSTTITLMQSQIVAISEQISKLDALLTLTNSIVSDHSSDIEYIQLQIIAIQDQIAILNTQQVETSSALSILSTTITSIQIQIIKILSQVDNLNAKQTATDEGLTDLSANLTASNNQLISLSLQFNRLLTQLGLVIDVEGNIYHTVTIGKQVWMAENLKSTKFRNGDQMPYSSGTNNTGYCWYDDDAQNKSAYGAMYTYNTVMDPRNICPLGWHVATLSEWRTLSNSLGGTGVSGGKLKETGTGHWLSPNSGASNAIGFNALPGGLRDCSGSFNSMGTIAHFLAASPVVKDSVNVISIFHSNTQLTLERILDCNYVSIRCIKDTMN